MQLFRLDVERERKLVRQKEYPSTRVKHTIFLPGRTPIGSCPGHSAAASVPLYPALGPSIGQRGYPGPGCPTPIFAGLLNRRGFEDRGTFECFCGGTSNMPSIYSCHFWALRHEALEYNSVGRGLGDRLQQPTTCWRCPERISLLTG